jgi:hypothetical protein
MLKKMIVVMAILAMTGTVFGAWSAGKFNYNRGFDNLPAQTIPDPKDPNKTIDNPAWLQLVADSKDIGSGFNRTVDWESDGNATQRKGESWNWPASYDFVPICDIRVRMDVGFWIRVNGCQDNIIRLKQRMINQYGGQTTCRAFTNVATEWKASFVKRDEVNLGGYNGEAAVDPSKFDAAPGGKDIVIKVRLKDVDLSNLPAGTNDLNIGYARVSVRPTVRPNAFMSGGSQSYPVYAPPPTDSTIPWW